MIVTRSPLRITLGGGGTDLEPFYSKHGGYVLNAAIDKYVYITLHETFVDDLIVKYSELERVPDASKLKHPIIRAVFKRLEMSGKSLELASHADIPAGTGLGSSSSFTTALLKALHQQRRENVQFSQLAEEACQVEIHDLGGHIGKQDQYAAAFGGINELLIDTNGETCTHSLVLPPVTLHALEDNLLLFFTGYSRDASSILVQPGFETDANLRRLIEIARDTARSLKYGDFFSFARMLTYQWENKKQRMPTSVPAQIAKWYTLGMQNGAIGGKLVGAGGGGFLMFYVNDQAKIRRAMETAGLREVRFRFDFEGTKVVVDG